MDIRIDHNIAAQVEKLARIDVERATEKALDRSSQVVLNAKRRQVDKTYARPIPRGKNGKAKWKRTGNFQREQTIQSKPGERLIGAKGDSEKYEPSLAKLPTGADGVNRSNPASEEAARIVEPQIPVIFEQELKNELGL